MVMIALIFLQQEEFYFCENVSTPPGVLFCRSHYVCWYFHVWIICLRSPQNSCDCVCNPVVWNQSEHVSHGSVQPASSPPASKVIKPSSSSPWTDHGSLSPLTLELELWWSLVGSLVCCCQQVAGSILRFSVQSFHVLPVCVCVWFLTDSRCECLFVSRVDLDSVTSGKKTHLFSGFILKFIPD